MLLAVNFINDNSVLYSSLYCVALEYDPTNVKATFRRAQINELMENYEDALKDYQTIIDNGHDLPAAREACVKLPRKIEERNEKMKKEMLGKCFHEYLRLFVCGKWKNSDMTSYRESS